METVQTWTDKWPWCMGMFGARFAVFVRRARVCHLEKVLKRARARDKVLVFVEKTTQRRPHGRRVAEPSRSTAMSNPPPVEDEQTTNNECEDGDSDTEGGDNDSEEAIEPFLGELPLAVDHSIHWLHRPGIVFVQCPLPSVSNTRVNPNTTVAEGFSSDWYEGLDLQPWTNVNNTHHRIDPCQQPHRRWTGDKDWRQILFQPKETMFSPSTNPCIRALQHTHLRLNRDFLLGEVAGLLPKLRFGVGDRVWACYKPHDYDDTKDYGDDLIRCEGEWVPGTIVMPYWRKVLDSNEIAENRESQEIRREAPDRCWLRHNGHYPYRNAAGEDEQDPLKRAMKAQDAMRRALPPKRQSYSIMAYQILLDPTETVLSSQDSGLIYAFMDSDQLVRSELENGRKPPAEFALDDLQNDYMREHMFVQLLCPSWWMMPGGYTLEDLAGIEDVDIEPGTVGRGLVDIELQGITGNPTLFHPDLVNAVNRRIKHISYEEDKRRQQTELEKIQMETNQLHIAASDTLRVARRDGKENSKCVVFICFYLFLFVMSCLCNKNSCDGFYDSLT